MTRYYSPVPGCTCYVFCHCEAGKAEEARKERIWSEPTFRGKVRHWTDEELTRNLSERSEPGAIGGQKKYINAIKAELKARGVSRP
jgi:hypothetical protein